MRCIISFLQGLEQMLIPLWFTPTMMSMQWCFSLAQRNHREIKPPQSRFMVTDSVWINHCVYLSGFCMNVCKKCCFSFTVWIIMVVLSPSGRTTNVTAAVLDDFKTLVRQHGMSDDTIVMNQNKGTNWRTGKAQVQLIPNMMNAFPL